MDGFFKVEVAPFPKSQNQEVGLPAEPSLKLTTNGEHPDAEAVVKAAVGCAHTAKHRSTPISVRMMGLRVNSLSFIHPVAGVGWWNFSAPQFAKIVPMREYGLKKYLTAN